MHPDGAARLSERRWEARLRMIVQVSGVSQWARGTALGGGGERRSRRGRWLLRGGCGGRRGGGTMGLLSCRRPQDVLQTRRLVEVWGGGVGG